MNQKAAPMYWEYMCPCTELGLPNLQNRKKYISVVYKPSDLWYSVIAAQSG